VSRTGFLIGLGVASLALYLEMWHLSLQFNWGEGYAHRPIHTYLLVYFALFVLYALGVSIIWKTGEDKKTFWTIIVFGLLFRAALLPAQQIQEDDIYRYLWDGKVFAHGINPYEYAPLEVDEFKEMLIRDPDKWETLYDDHQVNDLMLLYDLKWESDTSRVLMERINHPDVPTIYPPMAQYVFRIVHNIRADSILAMRVGFLTFDLLALVFIVLTLGALGKSRNYCLIYFWSPLVIKETFNSTHLDIIGISFLCVSVYWLVRQQFFPATFFLTLSVLGKLYPVILLPIYLKQILLKKAPDGKLAWNKALQQFGLFAGLIILFYSPFIKIGGDAFEGLRTYSTYWQSNDSIFSLLVYFYGTVLGFSSESEVLFSYDLPSLLGKITVMAVLGSTLIYLLYRETKSCLHDIFLIMTLVFILSPVQNPWYLCWVVPFLCFFKWRSLVLLTGLVGLYYMEFYLDYQDLNEYLPWLPWIEYTPFYLLLAWEIRQKSKGSEK